MRKSMYPTYIRITGTCDVESDVTRRLIQLPSSQKYITASDKVLSERFSVSMSTFASIGEEIISF